MHYTVYMYNVCQRENSNSTFYFINVQQKLNCQPFLIKHTSVLNSIRFFTHTLGTFIYCATNCVQSAKRNNHFEYKTIKAQDTPENCREDSRRDFDAYGASDIRFLRDWLHREPASLLKARVTRLRTVFHFPNLKTWRAQSFTDQKS